MRDGIELQKKVITSGISNKHSKGGQSAKRFLRAREEKVNAFFRRAKMFMDSYPITDWKYKGDKEMIKKFVLGWPSQA